MKRFTRVMVWKTYHEKVLILPKLNYSHKATSIKTSAGKLSHFAVHLNQHNIANQLCAQSLQSYPTLCNPTDGSPPGSSVHRIFQARILEWVAIPSSRESTSKSLNSGLSALLSTCSKNSALFLGHRSCVQSHCLACAHLPNRSLWWQNGTHCVFRWHPSDTWWLFGHAYP